MGTFENIRQYTGAVGDWDLYIVLCMDVRDRGSHLGFWVQQSAGRECTRDQREDCSLAQ